MYTNEIRKALIPALSALLESEGFALKDENRFWRETEKTTECLELSITQNLLKYEIFFEFSITLKEVSQVLANTFSFPKPEIPFWTLVRSSRFMTPKKCWEVKGPKSAAGVLDEILKFVSTDGLVWFEKNTDLNRVRDTLLASKFNNWRWRWHCILAICWMLKDASSLNLLLQKVQTFIEKTAPDETDFPMVYEQFRTIDSSFFPVFSFNENAAEETAKALCAAEKSKWDERIERTLKFGNCPQKGERCILYVIYANAGALNCDAAGWEKCLDSIQPVLDCIEGKSFTSKVNDKSSPEGEFKSMELKVFATPNRDLPNLLLIVEKQGTTIPPSRFSFSHSIVLMVRSNQKAAALTLAENSARKLAQLSDSALFVKQERPYWLEQSMDYGWNCPDQGIGTLRRCGWYYRRGELVDTLEGTWKSIPPE